MGSRTAHPTLGSRCNGVWVVTRLHVEHSTEEGGTIKGLERVGPQRGPATPLQTASPRWSPTCTIVAPRSGERVVVKMQMPVQPPVN